MNRRRFFLAAALCALLPTFALAAAKLPDKPVGSEVAFVSGIQKDLMARFPTAAQAEQAGYFRYTNEDNTGAISYANLQWNSADPQHPSQLWYDVHGNLLGADFSELKTEHPSAPQLWGVNPGRWLDFPRPHVHYILKEADGTMRYGLAVSGRAFTGAGGNLNDPSPQTIVKLGKVPKGATVARVFTFPALWDLIVWVKPNPNGAFADKNPLVHPSANAEKDSM